MAWEDEQRQVVLEPQGDPGEVRGSLEVTSRAAPHHVEVVTEGLSDCLPPVPRPRVAARLAVGYERTCELDSDGLARCWGWVDPLAEVGPPEGPFARLALGVHHSCGLHPDGEVTCWGRNDMDQLEVALRVEAGSWTLAATARAAGEPVAAGSTSFEAAPGAEVEVELRLSATRRDGAGRVRLVTRVCPEGPLEALEWSLDPAPDGAPGLSVSATLAAGAAPDRVVAHLRWADQARRAELQQQADPARWAGTLELESPVAVHDLEVVAEGLAGCDGP